MSEKYGINTTTFDFSDIKQYFKKEKNEYSEFIIKACDKIETLDWHYTVANRQRVSYADMKADLKEGYLFIEFDYKQKITIGLSPRQQTEEYYNQKQRSVLGFGIYYRLICQN